MSLSHPVSGNWLRALASGAAALAVALMLGAPSGPARANGILLDLTGCGGAMSDFGTGCSLGELITNNGSIAFGDKLFGNFRNLNWTRLADVGTPTSPAPEIQVSPFMATSGELGLEFTGPFSAFRSSMGPSLQTLITMVFDYDVSATRSDMLISDNTLELVNPVIDCYNITPPTGPPVTPICSGQTGVLIDETVTVPVAGGDQLAFKRVFADATFASMLSDHQIFTTALPKISVNTDIAVTTQTSGSTELDVRIDSFRQTFSQTRISVPEPGSLALFAAGLMGLGFLRRRVARARA